MFDCTTDKYEKLYARWLTKPGDLVARLGEPLVGKTVLDLAGGTGAVSEEAFKAGAKLVELFDLNPRPSFPLCLRGRTGANGFLVTRGNACAMDYEERFDVVFMRQALGYFELSMLFPKINRALKPNGKFVFNTFKSPRWHFKTYKLNGHRYVEAGGFLGDHVVHLQGASGIGVDLTKFYWHRADQIKKSLAISAFKFEEQETERSLYYICTKAVSRLETLGF